MGSNASFLNCAVQNPDFTFVRLFLNFYRNGAEEYCYVCPLYLY